MRFQYPYLAGGGMICAIDMAQVANLSQSVKEHTYMSAVEEGMEKSPSSLIQKFMGGPHLMFLILF